jgi:hypothetical protein
MEIDVRISGKKTPVRVDFEDTGSRICRYGVEGGKRFAALSDYLSDSPPEVVEDILACLFSGKKTSPDIFREYVSSDEFILAKRPLFLERGGFTCTSEGDFRSLSDSAQRLYDSGLLGADDFSNTYITWTKRKTRRVLGRCYPMFRVISISPILDSGSVPEDCLDFVVYHEFLHIRQGLMFGRRYHNTDFRRQEREFPGYDSIQKVLSRLGS